MGTTTLIGATKELYDINGKGTPEVKDLAATMAGGLIGYGVIRLFTIGYPNKHKRKSQSNYTGMKFGKF